MKSHHTDGDSTCDDLDTTASSETAQKQLSSLIQTIRDAQALTTGSDQGNEPCQELSETQPVAMQSCEEQGEDMASCDSSQESNQ